MKKIFILTLTILIYSFSYGQTVKELFDKEDYKGITLFENKSENLSSEDLYLIGYAFYQLANDQKAIEFYDKAMDKGLDDGSVHFFKGLSLRFLQKYDEALKEIEISIQKEPVNQEFVNEKGMVFYYQGKKDKALEVFEYAAKLPNNFGEPFYWIARIYHEKEEFNKALIAYYIALENVPKENTYYLTSLQAIGQLEYTDTKNYLKSAEAYTQVINMNPKDYNYYTKLIKAYNAGKEYAKADSIFELVKIAFNNDELSEEDMEFKNIAVDEDDWNGQKINFFKYLVDPKEVLDISYKVYLINKEGDKVERTFMVEKTIQLQDGIKHLLCEKGKKSGSHITYPYGWKTDTIPLDDLKKAVVYILDGKMKKGASSELGDK